MLVGKLYRVAVFVGIVGDYYLVGIIKDFSDKCVYEQFAHVYIVGIAKHL